VSWVLLILGTFWALCAGNLYRPVCRHARLAALSWVAGVLGAELAPFWLAMQAALTLGLVAAGALERPEGDAGLGLSLAAGVATWLHHRRAGPIGSRVLAALGEAGLAAPMPAGGAVRTPLRPWPKRPETVERLRGIPFSRHGDHALLLDVYRERGAQRRPVLLQVHGGAWVFGTRTNQALPLMHHMALRGWTCVSVDYRLSPRATFPDHLIDVKRALRWIRELGPWYGCDPDLVVVTGGSAGGHLAALLALTANVPEYQPGFESVDTRVAGCVPLYGVYDFADRDRLQRNRGLADLLERQVMKVALHADPDAYDRASPIARIHPGAPPFFVIQGDSDSLVPASSARRFVAALRESSRAPVVYLEVPGAQHAFDLLPSARTLGVVQGVEQFLVWLSAVHAGRGERPSAHTA
jgi:acetyl esterase/lipase